MTRTSCACIAPSSQRASAFVSAVSTASLSVSSFIKSPSFENALGNAESMDLGRPIVDAERAQVGKNSRDDRLVGDALTAEDLYAAINDAPCGLGHDDLGATGFVQAELPLVEHPCAVQRCKTGDVEIHVVVSQHETD